MISSHEQSAGCWATVFGWLFVCRGGRCAPEDNLNGSRSVNARFAMHSTPDRRRYFAHE